MQERRDDTHKQAGVPAVSCSSREVWIMRSQPMTILRINKLGKPYVQSSDPSRTRAMIQNDLWLNPDAGTMKMWNGHAWDEMQFGGSAIMDDCIANRMLANDISASRSPRVYYSHRTAVSISTLKPGKRSFSA